MSSSPRPQLPDVEPTYDPSRPFPKLTSLYNYKIPQIPGKSLVAVEVSFPPNGSTPPHYHPGAFVTGYVVSGYVFNARNEEPMEVKGPGEHFIEHPGCKHRISDNASKTEPAVLIATFVVETEVAEKGVAALVEVVKEYQAAAKEAQERTAAEAEKQN